MARQKQKPPQYWTLEYLRLVIKNVLSQYVSPELLTKIENGSSRKPWLSFEVVQDEDGTVFIRMFAKSGPFGASIHHTEFKYYSITYIDCDAITKQLFHTLTWEGGEYYWYKTHFKKRMVVAG